MGAGQLLLARIVIGAVSGGIASFCSCPIEVCLVRMQVMCAKGGCICLRLLVPKPADVRFRLHLLSAREVTPAMKSWFATFGPSDLA